MGTVNVKALGIVCSKGRKEGESAGEARNYSSVRCEDEEDLKFLHSTHSHTHTLWLPRSPTR